MKLILAAAMMLMLATVAVAQSDSQQLGPYAASFDLNANYQVQTAPPAEMENAKAYQIGLFVDNSTYATIGITEYSGLTDSTLMVFKSILPMSMMLQGLNVTDVEDTTIGGNEGILVTSEPFEAVAGAPSKVYKAMYWLDSQGCECGPVSLGTTSVVITSTYPLDITQGLLSSLQIVKGQAAPSAQDGQVLPPA